MLNDFFRQEIAEISDIFYKFFYCSPEFFVGMAAISCTLLCGSVANKACTWGSPRSDLEIVFSCTMMSMSKMRPSGVFSSIFTAISFAFLPQRYRLQKAYPANTRSIYCPFFVLGKDVHLSINVLQKLSTAFSSFGTRFGYPGMLRVTWQANIFSER